MLVRSTVCTFYPDLGEPERSYDFAVLAASEDCLALAGFDLSAYGLEAPSPLAATFFAGTIDAVARRVRALIERDGLPSCLDLLDRVVAHNLSLIQYRPFVEADSERGPEAVAQAAAGALPAGREVPRRLLTLVTIASAPKQ